MLETKDLTFETKIFLFFFSPVNVVEVTGLLLTLSCICTPNLQGTFVPTMRRRYVGSFAPKGGVRHLFF